MAKPASDDQADRETSFEMIMGVIALLFWSVLIVELIGITIIVGVTDIGPRTAALMLLVPALALWVFASFRRSWRRVAVALFPPYLG